MTIAHRVVTFGAMANKREQITQKRVISKEGQVMDKALKTAAKRAVKQAFSLRETILVEKDGWLVYVNAKGEVKRKVRRVKPASTRR